MKIGTNLDWKVDEGAVDMMDRGEVGASISRRPCWRPSPETTRASAARMFQRRYVSISCSYFHISSTTSGLNLSNAATYQHFISNTTYCTVCTRRSYYMNTQSTFNTTASTKTSSVRILLGCTKISLISPKRWTMNLNWPDVDFESFGGNSRV